MTLDAWRTQMTYNARVRAKTNIHDTPLAKFPAGCTGGELGTLVDIDHADGWLIVEFDHRGDAILVHPEEVEPFVA